MSPEQYLILILILLIGFLINFKFRINKKYVGSDCWFHLLMADKIRKTKFKFPKKVPRYILGNTYDYPPVIHYILSIIPKKHMLTIAPYIQQLIDLVNKLLLFLTTYLLFNDYLTAIIAVIIYSTTIITSQESIEPNPRTYGALFYFISILSLYTYTITKNPLAIILSILFISLICLTHRFAVQTTFFTTLIFTIYFKDITFIITFILGILSANLISNRHYTTILTSHIKQLIFWRKVYHMKLKKGSKAGINKNIVYIYELIMSNSWDLYTIALLLIIAPINNQLEYFIIWIIIIRVLSLTVLSFKELKFIGEGHRYLAYSALPNAIILAHILKEQNNPYLWSIFITIIIINIIALHIWQKTLKSKKDICLDSDSFDIFEKINRLPEKKILVLPNTLSRTIAYFCKKEVLFTVSPRHFKHILSLYWNTEDLSKIANRYRPELILIMNNIKKEYNLKFSKKIYENETYSLYKII